MLNTKFDFDMGLLKEMKIPPKWGANQGKRTSSKSDSIFFCELTQRQN